jgi:hypothetical protein
MKKIKKTKRLDKKNSFCVGFNSEPEGALITTHLFLKSLKISEIKKNLIFHLKAASQLRCVKDCFFIFFN